jgi:GntR family transcriptional regulator, vanillate catabolism transcriptional regulator
VAFLLSKEEEVTSALLDRAPSERVRTQTAKAVQKLRNLILGGQLLPGTRLSESDMVEQLGVSRTPARMAMMRLHEEGLLEEIASSGGFRVRGFSADEVFAVLEIRGILESLAARLAAERQPAEHELDALRACVADMDEVLRQGMGSPAQTAAYAAHNDRFHALLSDLARSPNLTRQLDRACALPFASPSSLLLAQSKLVDLPTILVVAQDQHRCIVDAIEERDGTRAEALTREHSRLAMRHLRRILHSDEARPLIPGHTLISGTSPIAMSANT